MQNDKVTLTDLSILTSGGTGSIFGLIDRCTTQGGRDTLLKHIQNPPSSFAVLQQLQDAVKFLIKHGDKWPKVVTNGTLVMLDKFFDSADNITSPPTGLTLLLGTAMRKLLNKEEYQLAKFSLSHLTDFFNGCGELAAVKDLKDVPEILEKELKNLESELSHPLVERLRTLSKDATYPELAELNYKARRELKNLTYRALNIYCRLDAWQSMALATVEHQWTMPELMPERPLCLCVKGMYHPLLQEPVSYDLEMGQGRNFLILTGANMSGKTTLMRSLGVGALLAHLGMGVPAKAMKISFMDGIITNMHVQDDILKGESYFYAEVQRMKHTAGKLVRDLPHLVLMDELFKGTNVHDAYECTKAVIDGLLNHPGHIMVLSTHLYEVANGFADHSDIIFSYFVTDLQENGSFHFTYRLQDGISDDRIGFRILQKEGVIALLAAKKREA